MYCNNGHINLQCIPGSCETNTESQCFSHVMKDFKGHTELFVLFCVCVLLKLFQLCYLNRVCGQGVIGCLFEIGERNKEHCLALEIICCIRFICGCVISYLKPKVAPACERHKNMHEQNLTGEKSK